MKTQPIKIVSINNNPYYYDPFEPSNNTLELLKEEFLSNNLDFFENLDLSKIQFYDQNFKDWFFQLLDFKSINILFKTFNFFKNNQITFNQAQKIFSLFQLSFDDFFDLDVKQFKTKIFQYKSKSSSLPNIEELLFKKHFSSEFDFKYSTTIDPILDPAIAQEKIEKAKQAILEKGLIPVIIFLQGSQNYELFDKLSDFDFKSICISQNPIIKDFKPKTIEYDHFADRYNSISTELLDIKSWNSFCQTISHFNISFLEIVKSKAVLINETFKPFLEQLFKKLEDSLSENAFLIEIGILGQMNDKVNALCHPYESKKDILKRFGYDPKQLHHFKRLELVLNSIQDNNITFSKLYPQYRSTDPKIYDFLMDLKTNGDPTWSNDPAFLNSKKQLLEDQLQKYYERWKSKTSQDPKILKKELSLKNLDELKKLNDAFNDCFQKQFIINRRFSNKNSKI